tara:strand:- start:27 stop:230 length:204 start_codon:yes stop_codon:yes gene_type:complete
VLQEQDQLNHHHYLHIRRFMPEIEVVYLVVLGPLGDIIHLVVVLVLVGMEIVFLLPLIPRVMVVLVE